MNKKILTDRKWHSGGDWFSPAKLIKKFYKSVVYCDYIETSGSAGDWTGLIIQKVGEKLYVIPFSQENTFPFREGYDINSSNEVIVEVNNASKIKDFKKLADNVSEFIYSQFND
jgi:hypothetical protein